MKIKDLKELIGYKLEEIDFWGENWISLYFRKGKETAVIYTKNKLEDMDLTWNP